MQQLSCNPLLLLPSSLLFYPQMGLREWRIRISYDCLFWWLRFVVIIHSNRIKITWYRQKYLLGVGFSLMKWVTWQNCFRTFAKANTSNGTLSLILYSSYKVNLFDSSFLSWEPFSYLGNVINMVVFSRTSLTIVIIFMVKFSFSSNKTWKLFANIARLIALFLGDLPFSIKYSSFFTPWVFFEVQWW